MVDRKSLRVIEKPTSETFYAKGYLDRNLDLAALKARQLAFDERDHFEKHGKAEGRTQFTKEFGLDRSAFNSSRYRLFEPLFNRAVTFLEEDGAFPVSTVPEALQLSSYDGESAHGLFSYIERDAQQNPQKLYMDLGCGFQNVIYHNCLLVEVYKSETADIIIEPNKMLPFNNDSFDGVSCAAVLEHVRRPWEVVSEIYRVLKPGGRVYIDWPFLQPFHGYPSHYYNATSAGLTAMFEDARFKEMRVFRHPGQGPDATVNWILRWFLEGINSPEMKEKIAGMSVADLLKAPSGSPLMKELLANYDERMLDNLAAGNCLIASKAGP